MLEILIHTQRDLSKFRGHHTYLRGTKIVKTEQNLKNIRKLSKQNFTNNFIRNLDIYSKGQKQDTVKTGHNLKNISKYDKNNLTKSFCQKP